MQQSLFGSLLAAPEAEEIQSNLLEHALSETVFTVIDVETTGLSPKKNALTEVTAIQYRNGNEIAKYSTLIKPTEPIPPEVEQITGISNELVQNAPSLISVLTELASFLGNKPIIVGHNVGFDIRFIREKFEQNGLSAMSERLDINRAFCTRMLALKLLPGLPSYEGIVVATACGIVNPNPHRAENDVRMSAGILFHLIEKAQQSAAGIKTVQDLITFQGPLN